MGFYELGFGHVGIVPVVMSQLFERKQAAAMFVSSKACLFQARLAC